LLALVVLLKSCHRLGYFPVLAEVPPPVTEHIRGVLELKPDVQARHDSDRTLRQHKSLVRARHSSHSHMQVSWVVVIGHPLPP
jgi:hypothetical protein